MEADKKPALELSSISENTSEDVPEMLLSFTYLNNLHEDSEFVYLVYKEIHQFLQKYRYDGAVLAFPCFNSKKRFIVHNLSHSLFGIETFSVGLHLQRRIVVCSKTVKKRVNVEPALQSEQMEKIVDNTKGAVSKPKRVPRPDVIIYRPPAVRRQVSAVASNNAPCTEEYNVHGRGRQLKSDQNDTTLCNNNEKSVHNDTITVNEESIVPDSDIPSRKICTQNTQDNVPINNSHCSNKETPVSKADLDIKVINTTPIHSLVKEKDHEKIEFQQASKEINKKKRIIKQSFDNSNELIINTDSNYNKSSNNELVVVDNWEDLLDEKLGTDLTLEIIEQVGSVTIQLTKEDYSEHEETRTLEGDYSHVLEIYGFPENFKTKDLVQILKPHKIDAFHIKWVDDCHALVVLSSGFIAQRVFQTFSHPLVKLRPLTQASKQSIIRAITCQDAMMPSAVRPQTCPQTARRMVTGALGLKLTNAREERAKEIKILKEAREKKRLSAKQEEDAWLGNPNSSSE